MYIAQKALKSMSSITIDNHEENYDLDDFIFTPKSGNISTVLSPTMSGRQPSLVPPADENFTIDPPSEGSLELQNDGVNSMLIKNIFQPRIVFILYRCYRNGTTTSIGSYID
jgi:hypothetical protein